MLLVLTVLHMTCATCASRVRQPSARQVEALVSTSGPLESAESPARYRQLAQRERFAVPWVDGLDAEAAQFADALVRLGQVVYVVVE